MGRPVDENYSRNQCSLLIRVDGDELCVPLNFNMSANEIQDIYPYLLDMFNNSVPNPALKFEQDVKNGRITYRSEKEYRDMLLRMKRISLLWYNKSSESLLSIALRFAVDIKLRGIAELQHLFETVTPFDRIAAPVYTPTPEPGPASSVFVPGMSADIAETAANMTEEEVQSVLEKHGMIHPTETMFDPGDEQDVPLGIAGDMAVNLYNSGAPADFLSAELDQMESRLKVEDRFSQVVEGSEIKPDAYQSQYKQGERLTSADMSGGLLNMYAGSGDSVLDALDREGGLDDPKFDEPYRDWQSAVTPEPESGAPDSDEDTYDDLENGNTLSFGEYDGEGSEGSTDEWDPNGIREEDGPPPEEVLPDDDYPDGGEE